MSPRMGQLNHLNTNHETGEIQCLNEPCAAENPRTQATVEEAWRRTGGVATGREDGAGQRRVIVQRRETQRFTLSARLPRKCANHAIVRGEETSAAGCHGCFAARRRHAFS